MRAWRRRPEDLRRRAFLEDCALVEEADAVGDVAREAHLVRGDDHRHARLGELADDVEDLGHELRVERAGDLVEEQQVRLHGQRAHDGDALLLAAREPVGVLVRLLGQAEARQQRSGLLLGLGPGQPQHLARRERDVAQDAHVREEVEGLEDDADATADPVDVHAARGDLLAVHDDAPGLQRLEQVDAAEQRRLARARRADEADDLVLADDEVDALQDLEVAEGLRDALDAHDLTAEVPAAGSGPPAGARSRGATRRRACGAHGRVTGRSPAGVAGRAPRASPRTVRAGWSAAGRGPP